MSETKPEDYTRKSGRAVFFGLCLLSAAFLAGSAAVFGTNALQGAGVALVGLEAACAAWLLRPGSPNIPASARWAFWSCTAVAVIVLLLSFFTGEAGA